MYLQLPKSLIALLSFMAVTEVLAGPMPRLGTLDQLFMSPFEANADDSGPQSVHLGAPYQDTWVTALVRNTSGKIYWVMQTDGVHVPDQLVALQSRPDGTFMEAVPNLESRVRMVDYRSQPGKGVIYTSAPGEPSVKLTFGPKGEVEWHEAAMTLRGHLAAPGIQFLIPWHRQSQAGIEVYYAEHHAVEGTLNGEAVKGFIFIDHNYDTVPWLQGAFNAQRGALATFTNEFEDGTFESGYFYCGVKDRHAIVVNSAGKKLVDTAVTNVNADVDEHGVLNASRYTLGDGSQWQFSRDPGASVDINTLMGRAKGTKPLAAVSFGKTMRVGDTRKVVRWWTSSESGTEPGAACSRNPGSG